MNTPQTKAQMMAALKASIAAAQAVWLKVLTDDGSLVFRVDLNTVDLNDPVSVVRLVADLRGSSGSQGTGEAMMVYLSRDSMLMAAHALAMFRSRAVVERMVTYKIKMLAFRVRPEIAAVMDAPEPPEDPEVVRARAELAEKQRTCKHPRGFLGLFEGVCPDCGFVGDPL